MKITIPRFPSPISRLSSLFFLFPFTLSLLSAAIATAGNDAVFRRTIERVASLDPAEAASVYASRAVALPYETLLEYGYEERPYVLKPCLASAMPEISADGLEYSFPVNTNVFFTPDPCFGTGPDGSPRSRRLSAEDFVYSLKRLADAKVASSGFWIVEGLVAGIDDFREASKSGGATDYSLAVEGLQAPSPDRLVIRLAAPSPVFLWRLALPYASAVPREAVEYYGAKFRDHPVGTGPYRLVSWRRNYAMRFARNPSWRGWDGSPTPGGEPFEELYFPTIDDPSTQWLCFLSGELDLQGEIPRDNWDEVIGPDGSLTPDLARRGITMARAPTLETAYIGINMRDPLLGGNKKLRQALNAAFDQPRWERFHKGRSIASNGPVPPSVAGADTSPLPFPRGVESAKRLLAEAGFPGGIDPATGRRLRLVIDIGKTTQDMRESTELLVSFMDACGIDLIPEYQSWPAFLKKVSEGRSQLFRIAWVGDYPDAENFLQLFYGPNAAPGPNRCCYGNPEYDRLFREALAAPPERRLSLYRDLQRIVKEECPWVFIGHGAALSLSGPRVSGYVPHDFPYGMEKHLRQKNRLR